MRLEWKGRGKGTQLEVEGLGGRKPPPYNNHSCASCLLTLVDTTKLYLYNKVRIRHMLYVKRQNITGMPQKLSNIMTRLFFRIA